MPLRKEISESDLFDTPTINKDFVCISDNWVLSAQISSCFNYERTYFSVLELPRIKRPDWRNEIIRLNNVLARIKPKFIIFAGVNSEIIQKIKVRLNLSEERYIYITNRSDIKRKLIETFSLKVEGEIHCLPDINQTALALLTAKYTNKRLIITSKASDFSPLIKGREHIVFYDYDGFVTPVVAANYAYACNANLQFISSDKKVDPDDTWKAVSELNLSGSRGETAKRYLESFALEVSNHASIPDYVKFATFITEGYPYGYLFPHIPSTHILARTLSSYFIASRIAIPDNLLDSSLVLSPVDFSNEDQGAESEINEIVELFKSKGTFNTVLEGASAGMWNMDNHIQLFPYNLLYISSHAGFKGGERLEIKFKDKNEVKHIITIDEVVAFGLTDIGQGKDRKIDVRQFISFVALDGQPWLSSTYKPGSSKTLALDFKEIEREEWDIVSRQPIDLVPRCSAIQTSNDFEAYLPMPHNLSYRETMPIIFNNACMSFHNFAGHFFFAGAGTYIGTMQSVLNPVAVSVSKIFFEKCLNESKPTTLALWEAENETYQGTEKKHIYLHVGCHFSKLLSPNNSETENKDSIIRRMKINVGRLHRIASESTESDVKQNTASAIAFLKRKLQDLSS